MRITITGTGYVGLVTAACLAEKGHYITCVDIDEKKIEALKEPVLEKEVEEYSNSIKEKGTPYIKFTLLIRNDLDKLLKEI